MKKTVLVIALALVLTFAFTASAFATTGKFYAGGVDYYKWTTPSTVTYNGVTTTTVVKSGVGTLSGNVAQGGGPHAGYLANTAKCGVCHSVHRAKASGIHLLPTSDATCAGCHTGSTGVTALIVTWTPYSQTAVPDIDTAEYPSPTTLAWWASDMEVSGATRDHAMAALLNKAAFGGAATTGGPHNDSLLNLIEDGYWDGTGTPPEASYETGHRYGCFTRRCHATNPHGANSSKYTMFASKLLFNESANADQHGDGTYGGLDAVWDDLGATDAAVERFVLANASVVSTTTTGTILIHGATPTDAEKHALVAGLTCGRPSNPSTGEDECHAEASYAIVDKSIEESRNVGTGMSSSVAGENYRTDNTGAENTGFGGNDNRVSKTGHVAGSFDATAGAASYAAIAGCTSCHDQTDSGNTVSGNFTFPHGQAATGNTNLMSTFGGSTQATAGLNIRARIWMGYAGQVGATLTAVQASPTGQKAYDGNCLKCHRSSTGTSGIGLTK